MENRLSKKYAVDNVTVATVSTPLGTIWPAGTRVTVTATDAMYVLVAPNAPGQTVTQLLAASKMISIPDTTAMDAAIAAAIAPTEPDIKVATGTIPAIDADTRVVVEVNLGELTNKTSALIGFFLSTGVDAEIQSMIISSGGSKLKDDMQLFGGAVNAAPIYPVFNLLARASLTYHTLRVTENYAKTMKFQVADINQKQDADVTVGTNIVYENLNNVLVGFYSTGGTGFLKLDKKVQLESAWLSQSGDDTLLHIALKNVDASANTAKDFKVAVYE
jgi:hypothetical protein